MAAQKTKGAATAKMKSGSIYRKDFPYTPTGDSRQVAASGGGKDKRKPDAFDQPFVKPMPTKIRR